MTPRTSLVGQVTKWRVFGRFWQRAAFFGTIAIVLAILSVFPQRYRAAATLTPADPATLGLSGALAQLGALNSVFGKQEDVEIALRVGTSIYTRDDVIKQLDLEKWLHESNDIDIHRWLQRKVDVRSLRGGIIQIEMHDRDPVLARDIVAAYTGSMRDRLAVIMRRQTEYKRKVLEELVEKASDRLDRAQAAYNAFRLANGYADPDLTVSAIDARVPALKAAIRDKDIAIAAASSLYSEDNNTMLQLRTERAALAAQLREALSNQSHPQGGTVGEAVKVSSQLFRLQRNLALAKTLYESYVQYLQGTSVEDLTSTANVRMLEDPYIDTQRQIWWPAAAGSIFFFVLWMSIEAYRLRPPIGSGIGEVETSIDCAE